MSGDERPFETELIDDSVPPLLAEGKLEIVGLLPNASNYTFLARASDGTGDELLTVYKPRRGEIPLWDFPEGTLCQREVAAYTVARALGWPNVPPTVLREGPEGPGSVQMFVEFDPRQHYFTLEESRADVFRRVALFDVVVNNADRKAGHCLLAPDGKIWVVDHGVCFSDEPKLRTVIWEYAGEEIEPQLVDDLRRCGGGDEQDMRRRLEHLLSADEVAAMLARMDSLVVDPRFPEPDEDRRPFPWPPI